MLNVFNLKKLQLAGTRLTILDSLSQELSCGGRVQ